MKKKNKCFVVFCMNFFNYNNVRSTEEKYVLILIKIMEVMCLCRDTNTFGEDFYNKK